MRSCLSSCLVSRNNAPSHGCQNKRSPDSRFISRQATESDLNFCIFNKNLLGQISQTTSRPTFCILWKHNQVAKLQQKHNVWNERYYVVLGIMQVLCKVLCSTWNKQKVFLKDARQSEKRTAFYHKKSIGTVKSLLFRCNTVYGIEIDIVQ